MAVYYCIRFNLTGNGERVEDKCNQVTGSERERERERKGRLFAKLSGSCVTK